MVDGNCTDEVAGYASLVMIRWLVSLVVSLGFSFDNFSFLLNDCHERTFRLHGMGSWTG